MSIGLLNSCEIFQHRFGVFAVASSKESSGNFYEIAGPDQMIAAEIVIALGKAPRYRQACDDGARSLVAMRCEDRRADAVAIEPCPIVVSVERRQAPLPVPPSGREAFEDWLNALLQTDQSAEGRSSGCAPNPTARTASSLPVAKSIVPEIATLPFSAR